MRDFVEWARARYVPNTRRIYLEAFVRDQASKLAAGGSILDAGAGMAPYRAFFSHLKYESADFCQVDKAYAPVDYVCDLQHLPVEDARFDAVLLSQVLEHLQNPIAVLHEMCRVLKPGGTLIWSAPLYFEEHEVPYDFYRYTQFGIKHMLETAGFEEVAIQWLEGYFGTLSYQADLAVRSLPKDGRSYGGGVRGRLSAGMAKFIARPLYLLLAIAFAQLDIKIKATGAGHCINYCGCARKQPAKAGGADGG